MEFLFEYGLFLAKVATFVIAIVSILILVKALNEKSGGAGTLDIKNLSEKYKETISYFESELFDEEQLKARDKSEKKREKARQKALKVAAKEVKTSGEMVQKHKSYLFVLDFKGSIDAREVTSLREEITAVLAVAKPTDEVLVRLETGGGMVHAYGLASSQLDRIKRAGIPLTICVDKVAASGGYMMACVADKIIAAPFAIVGSIGVIAQVPNFNKLLKKHDIEFEQITAGEFKRTLTMFGENTDKAREKFTHEIEETHGLFKNFITAHRPALEIEKVATGEHWYGNQALDLGLVDEVGTSDDLLVAAFKEKEVLHIRYVQKKKLAEKLANSSAKAVDQLLLKWIARGQRPII